jgi:D-3-phosphoglycerate dehydrogenase / 2-oxoglutarate reductase
MAHRLSVLLTHTSLTRDQYYGAESLAGLCTVADVVVHDADSVLDTAHLIKAARDVDLIVADRATVAPAEVFAGLPKLKAIVRCAVDIRTIDVAAASAAGVLVTRASPGFVDAVTELTLGLMIDLSRGVSRATADYQSGRNPQIAMGRQLMGSTVGIIGYGSIGRRLAAVTRILGMNVLVADPFATPQIADVEHVSMDVLLSRSDFVVCLAIANEHTENLIGPAEFRAMQPHACFLNLSRGNLVDEQALATALNEHWIAGAAIDVGRAPDQMPSPDLARLPNVIATPHIGGLTPQAISAQSLETVRQVAAIVAGDVPHGAVNAATWTRQPGKVRQSSA